MAPRQLRLVMFGMVALMLGWSGLSDARARAGGRPGAGTPRSGPAAARAPLRAPDGQILAKEREPNNIPTDANAMPASGVIEGMIMPGADVDVFAFSANAGDRVYAATMTAFSPASSDSRLQLLGPDGTTILESDDNDGAIGANASSIAGTVVPSAGVHYLRVNGNISSAQIRPYRLYLRVQSGAPAAETEPNDDPAQTLPAGGWAAGAIAIDGDADLFALPLSAGESIFVSLDADPERDGATWNPRLGIGRFDGAILGVDDASVASPNSEAHFMTVKESGTYVVQVDSAAGSGPTATYHLSVSVLPAQDLAGCATYASGAPPLPIGPAPGAITSTLTISGSQRISDLNFSIALTHTNMPDIDLTLTAPAGNSMNLITDAGNAAHPAMDLTLDDEAAVPAGIFQAMSGMAFQPELSYRLEWFDGQEAAGTWSLAVRDDTAGNGGNLLDWSLTVCSAPPPACPEGSAPTTVYSSDFEANNGGFTHSGTLDEWEWGAPVFAPITTSNSGTRAWKTDLDNTYNNSSSQDLLSPAIDLTAFSGPVFASWAHKYQLESATFDHFFVDTERIGGTNRRRLWEWTGGTMIDSVGSPPVLIRESAGWALREADISDYAGATMQLRFHLDSDSSNVYGGVAIDDVRVTACAPPTTPTPTATGEPPTATSEPPTATATATGEPPTATGVPPTATGEPPTATSVPPTATAPPARSANYLPLLLR